MTEIKIDLKDPKYYVNRELSWLDFNYRWDLQVNPALSINQLRQSTHLDIMKKFKLLQLPLNAREVPRCWVIVAFKFFLLTVRM